MSFAVARRDAERFPRRPREKKKTRREYPTYLFVGFIGVTERRFINESIGNEKRKVESYKIKRTDNTHEKKKKKEIVNKELLNIRVFK